MSFWEDIANPVGYLNREILGNTQQGRAIGAAVDPIGYIKGGLVQNPQQPEAALTGNNAADRANDIAAGRAQGKKDFIDDPRMQGLLKTREEMAKGYDGAEYGQLREEAKRGIAGQRSSYLSSLKNKLARGGVGGARAAAVTNSANQKYAEQGADAERRLALDSSKMKREGQNDLQDFILRQKYGELGSGLAYGQLGATDRAGAAATAANNDTGRKGLLDNLFGWL